MLLYLEIRPLRRWLSWHKAVGVGPMPIWLVSFKKKFGHREILGMYTQRKDHVWWLILCVNWARSRGTQVFGQNYSGSLCESVVWWDSHLNLWVKQIALYNMGGPHLINRRPEYKKRLTSPKPKGILPAGFLQIFSATLTLPSCRLPLDSNCNSFPKSPACSPLQSDFRLAVPPQAHKPIP